MKEIKHKVIVDLMNRTLERIPETSSGTYNRQDPTAFSKGSINTDYMGDKFRLSYYDCGWGVEIKITRLIKRFSKNPPSPYPTNEFFWKEVLIGSFYLTESMSSRDNVVIPRQKTKGLLKLLTLLIKDLEPIIHEYEFEEDPMGCLADYI